MKKLMLVCSFLMSLGAFAVQVGEQAPCVVLNNISATGAEADYCIREPNVEGQVKLLEFFSATCSACIRNLPIFSALHAELGTEATFRLVGIDRDEDLLRDYVTEKKSLINFDTALDTNRDAKRAYDVFATPTLFVLSADNTVLYRHVGVLRPSDVSKIRKIIKHNK